MNYFELILARLNELIVISLFVSGLFTLALLCNLIDIARDYEANNHIYTKILHLTKIFLNIFIITFFLYIFFPQTKETVLNKQVANIAKIMK